jgi:hypothetical protein
MEVGEEQVIFLAFFVGDEKDGAGETVGKPIGAGAGFSRRGLRPCRELCIFPVSVNLCWCGHVLIVLLWRVARRMTGEWIRNF